MMATKQVLSVGQCLADHASISRALRQGFGAEVVSADTLTDAVEKLRAGAYALVLVNRVVDADGSLGLDVIRQLKADPTTAPIPVMLVSNYDDAQAEAGRAGAVPGFGKAALGQPHVVERIEPYLL
jgi:CheY-like chemotaxis protein